MEKSILFNAARAALNAAGEQRKQLALPPPTQPRLQQLVVVRSLLKAGLLEEIVASGG